MSDRAFETDTTDRNNWHPGRDDYEADNRTRGAERAALRDEASRETISRANENRSRRDFSERTPRRDEADKPSLRDQIKQNFDQQVAKESRAEQRLDQHRTKVERVREREQQEAEEREAARPKTLRGAIEASVEELNQREPAAGKGKQADATERAEQAQGDAGEQSGREQKPGVADGSQPPWLTDHWEKIPREVQQAISTNWKQVHDRYHERWQHFDRLVDHYADDFHREGVHPAEGMANVMSGYRLLAQNPRVGIAWLAKLYLKNPDDQTRPLDANEMQALQALEQNAAQHHQQRQQQAERQTTNAVENWGSSKPHFQQLRNHMRDVLVHAAQQGQVGQLLDEKGAVDLDRLYAFSLSQHPQLKAEADKIEASQKETSKVVEGWGKQRPNFKRVRPVMATILASAAQNGIAQQFLDAKGRVNLDALYDAAISLHPELRNKASSNQSRQPIPQGRKQTSVRQSIYKAIDELQAS